MNYVYQGGGPGIPGLPHRISDTEAAARGLGSLLAAAIANGSYRALPEEPVSTETEELPARRTRRAARKIQESES